MEGKVGNKYHTGTPSSSMTEETRLLALTILDVTMETGTYEALRYDHESNTLQECFGYFRPYCRGTIDVLVEEVKF